MDDPLCVNPHCTGDPQTNQYPLCKGEAGCPGYVSVSLTIKCNSCGRITNVRWEGPYEDYKCHRCNGYLLPQLKDVIVSGQVYQLPED